jgi:hypothetical protein
MTLFLISMMIVLIFCWCENYDDSSGPSNNFFFVLLTFIWWVNPLIAECFMWILRILIAFIGNQFWKKIAYFTLLDCQFHRIYGDFHWIIFTEHFFHNIFYVIFCFPIFQNISFYDNFSQHNFPTELYIFEET